MRFLVQGYLPLILRQLHPQGAQLPFPMVVGYARQVALALHYTHGQGRTHGGVRSEHMLSGQVERKIFLDAFGLANLDNSVSDLPSYHGEGAHGFIKILPMK